MSRTVLGKYLQEREKVADMVARLKVQQNILSESIDSLSDEFQQPLFELKAKLTEPMVGGADSSHRVSISNTGMAKAHRKGWTILCINAKRGELGIGSVMRVSE